MRKGMTVKWSVGWIGPGMVKESLLSILWNGIVPMRSTHESSIPNGIHGLSRFVTWQQTLNASGFVPRKGFPKGRVLTGHGMVHRTEKEWIDISNRSRHGVQGRMAFWGSPPAGSPCSCGWSDEWWRIGIATVLIFLIGIIFREESILNESCELSPSPTIS